MDSGIDGGRVCLSGPRERSEEAVVAKIHLSCSLLAAFAVACGAAAPGAPDEEGEIGTVREHFDTVTAPRVTFQANPSAPGDKFGALAAIDDDIAVATATPSGGSPSTYTFTRNGTAWSTGCKLGTAFFG